MSNNTSSAVVEISKTANKFRSSIVLQYDDKFIDVKSILGLFTTLTNSGTYGLHIHGPDSDEAEKEMVAVFGKYNLEVEIVNQ